MPYYIVDEGAGLLTGCVGGLAPHREAIKLLPTPYERGNNTVLLNEHGKPFAVPNNYLIRVTLMQYFVLSDLTRDERKQYINKLRGHSY